MIPLIACVVPDPGKPETATPESADTATDTNTDTDTNTNTNTNTNTDTDTDTDTDTGTDTDTNTATDTATDTASPEIVSATDADVRIASGVASTDLGRVVRVGDVDGDGALDLVAATFLLDGRTGGARVFLGPVVTSGTAESLGLALTGAAPGTGTGRSLSVGDLDGDGIDDVGLGAPYDADDNGLYVAFGPLSADVSLATAALLRGPRATYAGHGSDLHGDVNGDGQADAVVGAYWTTPSNGSVYVKLGPVTGDVDLETEADAVLTGETTDLYAGRTVTAGADYDGDGIGDLGIACLGSMGAPGSGGLYVVSGPPVTMRLSDAEGRHAGATANDTAGLWLAAGDLDGDGRADLIASAYDDELAPTAGAAWVLFGPATGNADLSAADIVVRGDVAGQYGGGVDAPDLDGDGVSELLLGAQGDPTAGPNGGAAFLFWRPTAGSFVFTDADLRIYAEGAGDNLGVGLTAGDLDGDGVAELILGAPYEDSAASGAGAVYTFRP